VKPDRPVLFYDAECRFCRATARVIAALDSGKRFAMLPFSDPLACEMLASVPESDRERSIHVAQPDGWVASAGDALIELTRIFPGGRCVADAAWRNEPLHRLFRFGYQAVADRRGTLSRFAPDGPSPVRRPEPA
jgi:predicted DCC family thiol-disulfide oxidoreductase YuxK